MSSGLGAGASDSGGGQAGLGPFTNLLLDDGVLLQFADPSIDCTPVHVAFLLDDEHFVRANERIRATRLEHWADPQQTKPGETNAEHGGRGVYLVNPSGNYVELITKPYL